MRVTVSSPCHLRETFAIEPGSTLTPSSFGSSAHDGIRTSKSNSTGFSVLISKVTEFLNGYIVFISTVVSTPLIAVCKRAGARTAAKTPFRPFMKVASASFGHPWAIFAVQQPQAGSSPNVWALLHVVGK